MKLLKHIALEGPEGSGKSTLHRRMVDAWGFPSAGHSGGPTENRRDVTDRMISFVHDGVPRVVDRTPAVSDFVYRSVLGKTPFLQQDEAMDYLKRYDIVVVFMMPHQWLESDTVELPVKPHKPPEYVETLRKRRPLTLSLYDGQFRALRERGVWCLPYSWMCDPTARDLLLRLEEIGACAV